MSINELKIRFKDILITWQAEVKRRLKNYDRESISQYEYDLCRLVDDLSEAALIMSEKKHEKEIAAIKAARHHMKKALNSHDGHSDAYIRGALVEIEMDLDSVQ